MKVEIVSAEAVDRNEYDGWVKVSDCLRGAADRREKEQRDKEMPEHTNIFHATSIASLTRIETTAKASFI